jgi:hypothetical protein
MIDISFIISYKGKFHWQVGYLFSLL